MRGDIDIVKLLLQHGADISRSSALVHAKAGGLKAIVDLLENAGAADRSKAAQATP